MTFDVSNSPISSLQGSIEQAMFDVVPERVAALKKIIADKGISVVFKPDKEGFCVEVNTRKQILLGLAVLERLWAYAYAYTDLFHVVVNEGKGVNIDLKVRQESRRAMELLEWARECESRSTYLPRPQDMPVPDLQARVNSKLGRATQVFLSMIGFLELHEVGHAVLGHLDGVVSGDQGANHQEEYDADEWAAKWMLEGISCTTPEETERFVNRSVGMAVVLALFTSWEVHERLGESYTHPDPPKRLLRVLDQFVPETSTASIPLRELPWYMADIMLQLHLTSEQRELIGEYKTLREFYLDVMKALDQTNATP